MELFDRLAAVRDRWNVLDHPFYRRWERGDLTRGELAFYAGEYRHAVVALADATAEVARTAPADARAELRRHAAEESAHIALWDDFRRELGADNEREPTEGTRTCAEAWTGGADALEGLAVLHAVESAQPAIARTKLEGLVEHYGFEAGSPSVAYFALHAERDVEHAEESRELLAAHATPADTVRLVAAAQRALEGNWRLLDDVDAAVAVAR